MAIIFHRGSSGVLQNQNVQKSWNWKTWQSTNSDTHKLVLAIEFINSKKWYCFVTGVSKKGPHVPSRRSASLLWRRWELLMSALTLASTRQCGARVSGQMMHRSTQRRTLLLTLVLLAHIDTFFTYVFNNPKYSWAGGKIRGKLLCCRNVPYRIRVRLSRKRNEDEDSPNKLYTLVTYVPVTTCKGKYVSNW